MQRLAEKAFGRVGIAGWTQKKLERVPLRIHCHVKIRPDFLHFDGRLVHFPGVVAGFQMRPTAFFNLRGILLNESGRSWCDRCADTVRTSSLEGSRELSAYRTYQRTHSRMISAVE